MIDKSKTQEEHVDFVEVISALDKYKFCLNPNKYTFGVRSGKLLGFIISQRGIEVDSDKVKSIQKNARA